MAATEQPTIVGLLRALRDELAKDDGINPFTILPTANTSVERVLAIDRLIASAVKSDTNERIIKRLLTGAIPHPSGPRYGEAGVSGYVLNYIRDELAKEAVTG